MMPTIDPARLSSGLISTAALGGKVVGRGVGRKVVGLDVGRSVGFGGTRLFDTCTHIELGVS